MAENLDAEVGDKLKGIKKILSEVFYGLTVRELDIEILLKTFPLYNSCLRGLEEKGPERKRPYRLRCGRSLG